MRDWIRIAQDLTVVVEGTRELHLLLGGCLGSEFGPSEAA
jgi:hypothetical protein